MDWDNKLAVATSFEQIRNDRQLSKSVYCFDEANNIQIYPLMFHMRRDFPLQSELNKFIKYMTENGLTNKWDKKNIFGSILEKTPKYQYIEITLQIHLVTECILISLLLSTLLVLLIELFVYKKARAQNANRFWRYIEMMIDPYRYFLLNDLTY